MVISKGRNGKGPKDRHAPCFLGNGGSSNGGGGGTVSTLTADYQGGSGESYSPAPSMAGGVSLQNLLSSVTCRGLDESQSQGNA